MSIIDNIRIKQDWDPTGEKGGYKIDYAYQEPDDPATSAAVELSVSEKLDVYDGIALPSTLGELRRSISQILNAKILTASELAVAVDRAIGKEKKLEDILTPDEGGRVWDSIDDMVEDKYKYLALRPPAFLIDPYAVVGEKNFLQKWQEELLKEYPVYECRGLPPEEPQKPGGVVAIFEHDEKAVMKRALAAGYSVGRQAFDRLHRKQAANVVSFPEPQVTGLDKRSPSDGDL